MDDATSNISAVQAALATELNELVLGYRRTQLFYVAAKLGLADLLASGPQSVDALAAAAHVDASSLYRLLRALAGYGAFAEQEDGRFQLTPLAALLQADPPGSLRATVLAHGEDFYRVWGELFYSVQTGEPAFDRVYGLSNWAYRQQHPEANARFNALMASMARRRAAGVLSTYRFAGHRVVVDVGGGNGTLLVALLRHYPELRRMLVDQPHVIAQAHTVLATAGVAGRCIVLEGDFFAEVPAGGDFYILSEILHDWSDARASDILVRCHRAMANGAKLLIVERVVPKGNDPSPAKLIDIQMLVTNAGGRERTEHEWRRLVESAGFRVQSIVRTGEPWDILEAVPDRSCRSS